MNKNFQGIVVFALVFSVLGVSCAEGQNSRRPESEMPSQVVALEAYGFGLANEVDVWVSSEYVPKGVSLVADIGCEAEGQKRAVSTPDLDGKTVSIQILGCKENEVIQMEDVAWRLRLNSSNQGKEREFGCVVDRVTVHEQVTELLLKCQKIKLGSDS